jgi:hypothetical protein
MVTGSGRPQLLAAAFEVFWTDLPPDVRARAAELARSMGLPPEQIPGDECDVVAAFAKARLAPDAAARTPTVDLHAAFLGWAGPRAASVGSMAVFARRLAALYGPSVRHRSGQARTFKLRVTGVG